MKNSIKCLLLILSISLTSCYGTDDDTNEVCNGNCNVFTGRIYSENNVGISDVEITLSYTLNQIGANYKRIIAKSKTDINGNYRIEGFIKDSEFNGGYFFLNADENKIENSLSNDFYKPSEIVGEVAPASNEYLIPNLTNRSQIINIDYKIPYKTSLIVNLNDFNQTNPNDQFGVGNRIKYGFESDINRFLTKQSADTGFGYGIGTNSTLTIPSAFGENYLSIYRFKNGLVEYTNETVIINNPNTNSPLTYTY